MTQEEILESVARNCRLVSERGDIPVKYRDAAIIAVTVADVLASVVTRAMPYQYLDFSQATAASEAKLEELRSSLTSSAEGLDKAMERAKEHTIGAHDEESE